MQRPQEPASAPLPTTLAEEAKAVWGGPVYLAGVERRLAPYFAGAETRPRAMAYLRGLLGPPERKNSWQVAEGSGEATPYGFQNLLGRADWEADAVRDALRRYLIQPLGAPDAVLVMDGSGGVKKGRHSAGVARQYRGTAGRIESCQGGGCLASASHLGHALLHRELSLPRAWTADPARCWRAGITKDRRCATEPQLAEGMLARALAAVLSGSPGTACTGMTDGCGCGWRPGPRPMCWRSRARHWAWYPSRPHPRWSPGPSGGAGLSQVPSTPATSVGQGWWHDPPQLQL